jgi:hypothetical protein
MSVTDTCVSAVFSTSMKPVASLRKVGKRWSSKTFNISYLKSLSRDSSVGIATRYGLDGSGIESR